MAGSDSCLQSGHSVPSGWERLHPLLRYEIMGGERNRRRCIKEKRNRMGRWGKWGKGEWGRQ